MSAGDQSLSERIRALPPEKRRALEQALAARRAQAQPPAATVAADAGPAAPEETPGLSTAQARMWFLDRREPERAAYNVPSALRLRGPLDPESLRRALTWVVARHEPLRMRYREEHGEAVPELAPAAPPWRLYDLSDRPLEAALAELDRVAADDGCTPLELSRGVLRATLYRLAPDDHVLHLVAHHLAVDGWSVALLHRELEIAYRAFAAGREPDLPPLPARYADYVRAEAALLEGPRGASALEYWRTALADAPEGVNLPATAPDGAAPDAVGTLEFGLDEPHYSALKAFCRGQRVSLFVGFLALLQAALARYSHGTDIVVGTEVGLRDRPEYADLVGLFVNQLPLRTDLAGNPGLAELCARVAATVRGAFAHQDLPFDRLVRALGRQGERQPLFNVVLSLRTLDRPRAATEASADDGVRFEVVPDGGPKRFAAKFDLVFSLVDDGNRLGGAIEFDRRLFAEETVAAMGEALRDLTAAALAQPERPLGHLPLLARELAAWNDTARALPEAAGLHRLFEASAERAPDRPAILCGRETLTYGELERRANRLAWRLIAQGIGPEQVVACCLARGPDLVVAMLATLKAGGAVLVLDPAYASERSARILADAQPAAVLADATGAAVLPAAEAPLLRVEETGDAGRCDRPGRPVQPDQLAYLIYTSGSTGTPKGVMGHHRGLTALSEAQVAAFGLGPDDRVLQVSAVTFDAFIWELTLVWRPGASLVMPPSGALQPDEEMLALLRQARVTMMTIPPSVLEALPEGALPELHTLAVAGEACPASLTARYAEGRRMLNAYGPTETTVWASGEPCVVGAAPPIGRPVANMRLHLLDRALHPLPPGAVGEIALGGPAVSRGYLGQPGLTAERFRPDPFAAEPGARLYLTGDLGCRMPDGRVRYLGRADHQVKIRGFRVEPGEAEAVLRRHPAVGQAAVLAVTRDGRPHLAAWWTPRPDAAEPGEAELRAFARQHLPSYLRPSAYVRLDALPLTPHGKLDRRALPAPDWERTAAPAEAVEMPRPGIEARLAAIWSQVLGVPQIGRHDNFFELGGDSILSVQLVSRARAAGLELRAADLFAYPSLAALATVAIEMTSADETSELTGAELPLSPLQEGLLFHCLRSPELPLYVQRFHLAILGPLDPAALERAWNRLLARHESLRTRVLWRGRTAPVLEVAETAALRVETRDWRGLSAETQADRRKEWLAREAATGFELETAPLVRCSVVRLTEDRWELAWACHHLLVDGWSFAVIERELFALYEAERGSADPALPPAAQFRDYLAWLGRQDAEAAKTWWRARLAGLDTPLRIGEANAAPDTPEAEIWGEVSEELSPEADRRLRAFAGQAGLTLNTLVQAAWALVLSRHLRRRDLVYGLIVSGRPAELPGVEEIVGLFINTLPCRLQVRGGEKVRSFLQAVQARVAEMQDHSFLSLAELQRLSAVPAGEALFDTLLVVQNLPGGERAPSELEVSADPVPARTDYALTAIVEAAGRTALRFVHDRRALGAARTQALAASLRAALEVLPDSAEGPLASWPSVAAAQLPGFVTAQASASRPTATLTDLVAAQARARPDAVALGFEGETLSYGELERRSNRLAHWLRAQGVGPEVPVALYLKRSFALIEAMLAVMKAGGAFLPLSLEAPASRLAAMLADTAPPLVLTETALAADLPENRSEDAPRPVLLDGPTRPWAEELETPPDVEIVPESAVHIFYTSGSTGGPKGVVNTHGGLANRVLWGQRAYPLTPEDRVMQKTPYSFDVSVWEWLWPLTVGARLVIARPEGHRDPDYLAELAAREGVTLMHFVPSMLQLFVEDPRRLPRCTALRRVLCSGEAVGGALRDRVAAQSNVELLNLYGPTEASIEVSHWRCAPGEDGAAVPMGRPIEGAELRVIDPDGQPCPLGVAGELLIGGLPVARGYRGRPGLTAERFVPDPLATRPGARAYRTGDLAAWRPDGALDYLGRLDWQVKIRGQRVEPGEIEEALRACPGVRDAVADYRKTAAGDGRLVAYLVGASDLEAVRTRLASELPAVMQPAAYVTLDALPLSASGKLDRKALPDPEQGPATQGGRGGPPRGEIERAVAGIFAEVLGLEAGRIGREDHFAFELGGHSLQVLRALGRLERQWPGALSLAGFLAAPTVASLAGALERQGGNPEDGVLVPLRPEGTEAPLFLVHPALGAVICYLELARHLPEGRPVYALQAPELAGGVSESELPKLAARYLAAARSVQPEGPLALAGYSHGGLLAFEMARQAAEAGTRPALLAVLDTLAPPAAPSGDPGADETALLAELAGVLERYAGGTPSLAAEHLRPLPAAERLGMVQRHLAARGVLREFGEALDLPAMLAASRSAGRGRARYRPGAYAGDLALLRCAAPSAEDRDGVDPAQLAADDLGWSRWVSGRIATHSVPGDHVQLLRGGNAAQAAGWLAERLGE